IAAERLGLPTEDVTVQLGDSFLSWAPVEGGSFTAATVGSAVHAVCDKVRKKVFQLARKVKDSPLAGADLQDVTFADAHVRLTRDPSRAVPIAEALRQGKVDVIDQKKTALPNLWKQWRYSRHAHSAVFAEAKIDED